MMKKRTVLILLAALVLSLSACEKQPEPAMDTQAPPVLAAPAEASAPEIPAEPESEPEKEWTQADIRRMYKAIKEPEWAFIDCLTTPDKANNCVGAVLYWDGERQPHSTIKVPVAVAAFLPFSA